MTNQTIPPCPVCGTVPEHHDRIFCGLVNKCNCLSANRDCTIDAWTRWCAEELRRACRELGIETVEQVRELVGIACDACDERTVRATNRAENLVPLLRRHAVKGEK